MLWAATTTLAFLFIQTASVPTLQQGPPSGGIQGLVSQADSNDPIPKAQVTLTRVVTPPVAGGAVVPAQPFPPIPPVITDNAGKFAFTELEPGQYRINAGRNGFVRMNYGERFSGGPGTVITVPAGQVLKDINFKLTATATVSGRVRDQAGDPAAGAIVQLLRPVYNVNGRTFQSVGSTRTDDRGEYRLFWISPGRYYLAIGGNRNALSILALEGILVGGGASPNEIPAAGQATVLYPGVVDPQRATTIEIAAGRELAGIDIVLPQQTVYRVRGRLLDAAGQPPRTASIQLISRDPSFAALTTATPPNYNAANGTFDLRDVVPGAYWLRAQAAESTATAVIPAAAVGRTLSDALNTISASSRQLAQIPLDVAGDMDSVVVTLSSGLSVSGVLRAEGTTVQTTSTPTAAAMRVALRPTAPNGLSPTIQPVNADGTFSITNIFPGEYRVTALPLPPDAYVKEARIDQADVLNQPWVIGNSIRGNLEVVVSGGAGQIDGVVVDSRAQPVSAIQAILIPDQDRSRTELLKTAVSDQQGRFTFRSIAPGSYKIFAWEGIEANSFYDPEVLSRYEQQGKAVRVTEGAKLNEEVKMIPSRAQ